MPTKNKLVLKSSLALGDDVVLTATVRELSSQGYHIAVDTPHKEVWEFNPCIEKPAIDSRIIKAEYQTEINSSNSSNRHFAAAYLRNICEQLGIRIRLSDLRPALFTGPEERGLLSVLLCQPYWVVMLGGKSDFQVKWWDPLYFQRVIDILSERVQLVAAGAKGRKYDHVIHPRKNIVDMVGQTTTRQLIRLIRDSEGVICPVTCGMHIAAAFNKPCIVIAGGREPYWWEAYTRKTWEANCSTPVPEDLAETVFLHTIGKLGCCYRGGCHKTGILSTIDPDRNCLDVETGPSILQPACLKLIKPEDVAIAALRARGDPESSRTLQALENSPRLKHIAGPVTICTVLHGGPPGERIWSRSQQKHISYTQMHARCIDSILDNTPAELYELRIGCNQVCDDTAKWLARYVAEQTNIKLFMEPVNVGKEPLMRRMFAGDPRDTPTIARKSPDELRKILVRDDYIFRRDGRFIQSIPSWWHRIPINLRTQWLIWLDDDAYINDPNWLFRLDEIVGQTGARYIGYAYVWMLSSTELAWMTGRPWWNNQFISMPVLNASRIRFPVSFMRGAAWAIRVDCLKALNWPDPALLQSNDDVILGAAVQQQGWASYNLGGEELMLVENINKRGLAQPPVGHG